MLQHIFVVALALTALACADGHKPTPSREGGQPPAEPDAGLPLQNEGGVDANASDAAEPAFTNFRVTVTQGALKLAGVGVLLHDEAGTVIAQLVTDAHGRAGSDLTPSMATLVFTRAMSANHSGLRTYTGLEVGDHLKVELPLSGRPLDEGVHAYDVTLAPPIPWNMAGWLDVRGCGCTYGELTRLDSPVRIMRDERCGNLPARETLLAVSHAELGGTLSLAMAQDVAVPRAGEVVPVTMGPWVKATATIAVTGLPADAWVEDLSLAMQGPECEFGTSVASNTNIFGMVFPLDPTKTYSLAYVPGYPEHLRYYVSFHDGKARRTVAESYPVTSGVTIDLSELLPTVTATSLEPQADPQRPVVTWSLSAPSSAADAVAISLILRATSDQVRPYWTFHAPPDTTSLTVPELPLEALADWGWDGDSGGLAEAKIASMTYYARGEVEGYREFLNIHEIHDRARLLARTEVMDWQP